MSETPRTDFWGPQFEDVITEIARQAMICGARIAEPGVVEAVLRNDEAACGSTNPIAFRKLRDALMMVFVMQGKAYEQLGAAEADALIDPIRKSLRARFHGKLGTPPAGA
jgi:hypothetical protein